MCLYSLTLTSIDLAASNKTLVELVTKQEDGIAENRKMAMLMLKQLAEQSTLQSLAMAKGDERAHIAQEAQMKASEQTNNILLEVMKQNKNVAGNLSTIEKMADMNKASTIQLRIVERKAEDAERKADEAEIKANEAEIKAENAEKEAVVAKNIAQKSITEAEGATATANRYKRDCEKAVQELNELDIINNPKKIVAEVLVNEINIDPDRFRGKNGNQGIQGNSGTQGVRGTPGMQGDQGSRGTQGAIGARGAIGSQGANGCRGAGFWEDTGRALNPFK